MAIPYIHVPPQERERYKDVPGFFTRIFHHRVVAIRPQQLSLTLTVHHLASKPERFAQLLLGVRRSGSFRKEGIMHARKDKTEKRSAWLMELGRELRAEYADFIRTSPLSPRLAALLEELENAAPASRQQGSSVAPTSI